ncbi:hypothetical protein ACP4OV_005353 [Aristida adscensionis]
MIWNLRKYGCYNDMGSNNEEEVLESLVPHDELKTLELDGYGGYEISKWMRDPQMFQCLRALRIFNCPRCKDLPIVWLSSSLEELYLSHMSGLATLCKNIDVEAMACSTSLQIFPRLKRITLIDLRNLDKWAENSAGENNSSVIFPQLETLRIDHCSKLSSLPRSSVLTHLTCINNDFTEARVCMNMPLGSWASLVSITLQKTGLLMDMRLPLDDDQNHSQRTLDVLRSLKLKGDDSFVSIFNLCKLQLQLRDCFAFVEELDISSCRNIAHWPLEEFQCLPCLRFLHISDWTNLEGKELSSEEILPLPHLEKLWIVNCYSLLQIPKLPISLQVLAIVGGRSLGALPSNLGDLANLRVLYLRYCVRLKAMPDGMDGLSSLEMLKIVMCPGIEKFPQGLLQRLTALKALEIWGCPDLFKCCIQGAEYFDLISSIPDKYISRAICIEPPGPPLMLTLN